MLGSFIVAGFECATGYNRHGAWIDQIAATGHDQCADADYAALREHGIRAARDGVRWPLVDLGGGRYDFSSLDPLLEAARRHRVQVIWDLFHYGYPKGCDPFSEAFAQRFADYCYAVGRHIDARTDGTCWFTPVNEPSYLAYAGGDAALFAPHATDRGWDLKVSLCRAAIAGVEALWAASPGARMVHADPLCQVTAHPDRPHDTKACAHFNHSIVMESWDMIAGRLLPELGGSRAHLDVVGVNYYWTNQWEFGAAPEPDGRIAPLHDHDHRRSPLRDLIGKVWRRYGNEVMISETAHVGDRRGPWLREAIAEARALLEQGAPLIGLCVYPVLGMPEWHDRGVWTHMGLWDPIDPAAPHAGRRVHAPAAQALRAAAGLPVRQPFASAAAG